MRIKYNTCLNILRINLVIRVKKIKFWGNVVWLQKQTNKREWNITEM